MRRLPLCAFVAAILFATSAAAAPPAERRVSLAVVGDIMTHRLQILSTHDQACDCHDFSGWFTEVKDLLSRADITAGNLETTLPGKDVGYSGYPRFGTPDELIPALVAAGFDLLTTANNHSLDKGAAGVRRTIEVLDKYKLPHVGTAGTASPARKDRVVILEKNGLRLAFLGYTEMTNGIALPAGVHVSLLTKAELTADLAAAHALKPDATLVFFHFGQQYERTENAKQRALVTHAFKEGADVVLGSHPHVVQPVDLVRVKDRYGVDKDRLVVYSLGNFVSNYRMRYAQGGIVLRFELVKSGTNPVTLANVDYAPVWIHSDERARGLSFHVLAVDDFVANDRALRLPAKAHERMMLFAADTAEHLAPVMTKLRTLGLAAPTR